MTTTETTISNFKINFLTKQQYDTATKSNNELYAVTDEIPLSTSDIVSSVSSSSTNSQCVGAKLFYDTVGNIEAALNTINSGSST